MFGTTARHATEKTRIAPASSWLPLALATSCSASAVACLLTLAVPVSGSRYLHIRKTGLLISQYAEMHDGTLPLAMGQNADTGQFRWSFWIDTPENWRPDRPSHVIAANRSAYPNSLRPYGPVDQWLANTGDRRKRLNTTAYESPSVQWTTNSLVMNGLLHQLPIAEVAIPQKSPLVWPGFGKTAVEGFSISNPTLWCTAAGLCRFHPNQSPVAGGPTDYGDVFWGLWIGREAFAFAHPGLPILSVDNTLYYVPGSGHRSPALLHPSGKTQPFDAWDEHGNPISMAQCRSSLNAPHYACFFRPDNDFED